MKQVKELLDAIDTNRQQQKLSDTQTAFINKMLALQAAAIFQTHGEILAQPPPKSKQQLHELHKRLISLIKLDRKNGKIPQAIYKYCIKIENTEVSNNHSNAILRKTSSPHPLDSNGTPLSDLESIMIRSAVLHKPGGR